jgi:carbon-monoxide dehydrogenase small subunit
MEEARMTEAIETQQMIDISLKVNGEAWSGEVRAEETLLEFLREQLRLTGTKRSCESQVCGVCTVLVDGKTISSCTYLAFEANEKGVTTIEGLASGDQLTPIQEAFIRRGAAQCGFCTSGMLITITALLKENPKPTREEIGRYLNGNICRCGAYVQILEAIQDVSSK